MDRAAIGLSAALVGMRDAVADARFPLPLPTAADAVRTSNSVVKQLQDYLIPRVERIDAPLLVVVG
ncbi:MAG TPA: ABC transporter, partial [Micromonosporaceae bacterium]